MNDDYDPQDLGERPTPVVWQPRRSAGSAVMIFLAGALVGVLLLMWLFS